MPMIPSKRIEEWDTVGNRRHDERMAAVTEAYNIGDRVSNALKRAFLS